MAHPLRRSARHPPEDTDAGITRPYLSRLTRDVGDDSLSDKRPVIDRQERIVVVHKVSPKDSLPGVSLRYGIPLAELRQINQLWASDPIHLRDVLYIPVDKVTRTLSSPDPLQHEGGPSISRLDLPPSATIQRIPSSQLSFFPPSPPAHRRRQRRRSLTDSQIPRSQPATLSRSHTRNHSHHSTSLSSLLTALPTAASTRNSIVPRLSFDSISSSFDDRSRSQSDNEENHELEEVVSRDYPTVAKVPRTDVYDPRPSASIPRHRARRILPLSPPSSYIPSAPLSVIRTVQMEPSPTMQIPKKMNSTLIHDQEGKTESLISRSKVYASAHNLMETDAMNKRLLR
ncbi:hypothetical protein JOM56_002082 [Amanita muscaria]